MGVAGCLGKKDLSTGTIGFSLAPRINAAGRLERAMLAVEMLTTDDHEPGRGPGPGSSTLCNKPSGRRSSGGIVEEAHAMIAAQGGIHGPRARSSWATKAWHPGVIGIVASRLVETYHRPAIVVALGAEHGQGSARSVAGFNLYDAISACSAEAC